jgi:putative endonuclease
MRDYFVDIMSNVSRTLYIGMTNNLERRVFEHKSKENPGFTKQYNLTLLVYAETYPDPTTAIAREKQLKGWLRARKIALIESVNPTWQDLSAEWFR